jgi:hypothetical protein
VTGYYLTADRADRVALARLVNDLEQLPNSEGSSGGGLSPRLEAELIKMLARPIARDVATSVDKIQLAAVFGLLGMFVGVLAVGAAVWLHQLHLRLQEQNESLQALSRIVEQSAAGQRLLSDTLLEKLGGDDPGAFVARYEKAAKARDEAARQLGIQRSITDALGSRAKELEASAASLASELALARKELEHLEKDAKEAPKLREQVASLEETKVSQQHELDKLAPLFESDAGKKVVAMQSDLLRMRYAAYSGWGVSALLSLGLVAAYLYFKPPAEDASEAGERPPHRIE